MGRPSFLDKFTSPWQRADLIHNGIRGLSALVSLVALGVLVSRGQFQMLPIALAGFILGPAAIVLFLKGPERRYLLTLFGATACFFSALGELPLGQVTAVASATPLIVVAVAGPLLGERVARSAVLGATIGFAGSARVSPVVVCFRPMTAQMSPAPTDASSSRLLACIW